MEPGDFKSFYVHKYLEEELSDLQFRIARVMEDQGYQISTTADKERSEIPPHPEVKMGKTLKEFGEFLMALDNITLRQAKEKIDSLKSGEQVDEKLDPPSGKALSGIAGAGVAGYAVPMGATAAAKGALVVGPPLIAIYAIGKFLFKKQKFSFARFLKALGRGKSRSKLYSNVLKQMKLNPKEQANIAWYFSKKGNVKKFAKKYLRDHSEYKEIINQDESRISNAIFNISRAFTGKRLGAGRKPKSDEGGDTEDTTDTPSTEGGDPIEEALKPIIRKAMKEILEK